MIASTQTQFFPSLLGVPQQNQVEMARQALDAGADGLHLDFIDGRLVLGVGIEPSLVRQLRRVTDRALDAHLMLLDPDPILDPLISAGVDLVTIHIESLPDPIRSVEMIRSLGASPGIAISPQTAPDLLKPLLPFVDRVLVMGVFPGASGRPFLPETVDRVSKIASLLKNGRTRVVVDGGVSVRNVPALRAAGAGMLVVGSAFFGSDRPLGVTLNDLRIAAQKTDARL